MPASVRLLYLDDSVIDHRLMRAYLRLDGRLSYEVTACTTLEEASLALASDRFDALVLDNRVPPYANYRDIYRNLQEMTGFDGRTVVVSADVSGEEFAPDNRLGGEVILDKAQLLSAIRSGAFAQAIAAG